MQLPSMCPDETDGAEPVDFFSLVKGIKETALHLAVRLEEKSSLALVDFLCQNRSDPARAPTSRSPRSEGRLSSPSVCSRHSNCLEKRTAEGNTALHYSVLHHKPESLKLLLKAKAALHTGAILKTFTTICFALGVILPNNPNFYQRSHSKLCRGDRLGYCTEAPAHTVCRSGETISSSVNPTSVSRSVRKGKKKLRRLMEMIPCSNSPCS